MKSSSIFSYAFTITGAFIGAGFASGQELWQFFASFGLSGFLGFSVAAIGLSFLSFIIIKTAINTGADSFDSLISPNGKPFLKKLLIALEAVFYYSIFIIMTAGAESLLYEQFGFNKILVGTLFVFLTTLISLLGVKWIISVFSATVPILTASVVIISIFSLIKNGFTPPISNNQNAISVLFSAIVYISYNFIAAIGVFASISKRLKSSRGLGVTSVFSALFLLILGCSIILGVFTSEGSSDSALPMVAVASSVSTTLGAVYSLLLILAMFGASLASVFPIVEALRKNRRRQIIVSSLIALLCIPLSTIGFKELINKIYPMFGYIGFAVIALVIYNYFTFGKKENS